MKKFLLQIALFSLCCLIGLHARCWFMLQDGRYKKKVFTTDVHQVIDQSKTRHKARKLLLGDSVGRQFYNTEQSNDTLVSLACNQAISMAGQYHLLSNYLAAGNSVDTVYLFFSPFSFLNNLDQGFTYNYYLKTFHEPQYVAQRSALANAQIDKIPFHQVAGYFCVFTTDWAPDYDPAPSADYNFISPISAQYLHKIVDLSHQKHFRLVLVPALSNEAQRDKIEGLDKSEISKYQLDGLFANYFKDLRYLDASQFQDHVHLKDPEHYKPFYKNLIP